MMTKEVGKQKLKLGWKERGEKLNMIFATRLFPTKSVPEQCSPPLESKHILISPIFVLR